MKPIIFPLPGNESMAALLVRHLGADASHLETRRFPDEETYLRYAMDPKDRDVVLVCGLERPDAKILPLIFAADTARDLGARSVGLVAPYLAYMRQDRRFHSGEAVTSRSVGRLLSQCFDWLVTVDPHLHRYHALSEVYSIPADALHASSVISGWIKDHVKGAVLIGPDSESEQWVSAVARNAGATYAVLQKTRLGDRDVTVQLPEISGLSQLRPVLVDDIISSGRTMLAAIQQIKPLTPFAPLCIGVHGIFADNSDKLLADAGAEIVTSNTIPHPSNRIDVSVLLASAVTQRLSALPSRS